MDALIKRLVSALISSQTDSRCQVDQDGARGGCCSSTMIGSGSFAPLLLRLGGRCCTLRQAGFAGGGMLSSTGTGGGAGGAGGSIGGFLESISRYAYVKNTEVSPIRIKFTTWSKFGFHFHQSTKFATKIVSRPRHFNPRFTHYWYVRFNSCNRPTSPKRILISPANALLNSSKY